jgi:hypothetical protein
LQILATNLLFSPSELHRLLLLFFLLYHIPRTPSFYSNPSYILLVANTATALPAVTTIATIATITFNATRETNAL